MSAFLCRDIISVISWIYSMSVDYFVTLFDYEREMAEIRQQIGEYLNNRELSID